MVKRLLLTLVLFIAGFLAAEQKELRPYRLIHADSLKAVKIQGAYVSQLTGNVHFFYGNTEFYTDFAHIYESEKLVKMIGNVQVFEDTLALKADEVEYFRSQEKLKLLGDVFLKETHADSTWRTFKAQKIEFLRTSRDFQAWENVNMFDSRQQVSGICGYLTYNSEKGFGFLRDDPVLTMAQEDTITISAQRIEYYNQYKKIVAVFEVETLFSEYLLTSDFLIYFAEQEKAIYRGQPQLFSPLFDAEASEVTIWFAENSLEKAELRDSCLVTYKIAEDTPKVNTVSSEEMHFIFQNQVIKECRAFRNIDSFYFQDENISKRQDFLKNLSHGEELIMYMNEKGYINQIDLHKNISGKYTFRP